MVQRALAFVLILVLAGCSLGAGLGKKPAPVTDNPITGAAIATTALDAPKPATPKPDAAKPEAIPQPVHPIPTTPATTTPADPEPAISLPPEALTCAKKGDKWLSSGKGTMSCVHFTRDSGKECSKQSQCEGYCLARSGTCAPVTPMFGCNEILQNDGVRSTICLD